MADKGWTQSDLAVAAGISPSALSRFFNIPDRDIDVSTLLRIADALRVLPGDLLPHTTDAVPEDVSPMVELMLGQPTEVRRQLEEMARLMVATYEIGCAATRVSRHARVGQTPIRDVTPPATIDNRPSMGAMSPTEAALLSHPQFAGSAKEEEIGRREHSNKAKKARGADGDEGHR